MASRSIVVIETPVYNQLSPSLTALLADQSIAKIFCGAKEDIRSLQSRVVNHVDLQSIIVTKEKGKLGLAQVISAADPRKRKWTKQSFKKNKWWQLRSSTAMMRAPGFVQYAAADAWGTGRAYCWYLKSQRATSARPKASRFTRKARPGVRTTPELIDLCDSPDISPPRKQLKIPLRRAPMPMGKASHLAFRPADPVVHAAPKVTRRLADEASALDNSSEIISGKRKDAQKTRTKLAKIKKRKRSRLSRSDSVEGGNKKKKMKVKKNADMRKKRKRKKQRQKGVPTDR